MRHVCFSLTGIGYEMDLILIFPSGNQTWQWKIHHLSFMAMDDFPSQKPPFPVDFPLPMFDYRRVMFFFLRPVRAKNSNVGS